MFFARMLIGVALSAEGTGSLVKELACEDWSCHMSKPFLMPMPPTHALPHLGDGVCRADYLTLISRSGWVGEKRSDALGANSKMQEESGGLASYIDPLKGVAGAPPPPITNLHLKCPIFTAIASIPV